MPARIDPERHMSQVRDQHQLAVIQCGGVQTLALLVRHDPVVHSVYDKHWGRRPLNGLYGIGLVWIEVCDPSRLVQRLLVRLVGDQRADARRDYVGKVRDFLARGAERLDATTARTRRSTAAR